MARDTERGCPSPKGSHGTLYYGEHKTTVKDRKKEIGEGLLRAMLKQLGLSKKDIE